MSFTMMAKAKPIKTGNSGRKLVLMMLADIADDTGRCFPSYQHIADVCEMSRRSVITHISKLVEANLLNVTHRKSKGEMLNSSNIYQLTLNQEEKAEENSGENFALPSEMVALPSENSALGGSENSAPITYHSSYPINEPIKENINFQFLTADEFNELTKIRIENHKAKKAKAPVMTQRIANTLVNQISLAIDNGFTVDDVLNEFATRGWLAIKAEWMPAKEAGFVINNGFNAKQIKNQTVTAAVLDVKNTNW
jgi:DNA replication protein DnaD